METQDGNNIHDKAVRLWANYIALICGRQIIMDTHTVIAVLRGHMTYVYVNSTSFLAKIYQSMLL